MSVIEHCTGNCQRSEALAQTLFIERQDLRSAKFSARMAAMEQERLADQLRGAEEALRWYAEACDPDKQRSGFGDVRQKIAADGGRRARAALGGQS